MLNNRTLGRENGRSAAERTRIGNRIEATLSSGFLSGISLVSLW